MDDLLEEFLAETTENLEALTNDLVAWEKNPGNRPLLDGIFRFFHTIKGNSGFLDFIRLGHLSHAAETALGKARDGKVEPDGAFVSTVLEAIDHIQDILTILAEKGGEPEGDDSALIARLEHVAIGGAAKAEEAGNASAVEAGGAVHQRPSLSSVRVSVGLLDRLMGLASELVLTRNALVRTTRQGQEVSTNLIERLSACVTDLQDGINRTRMQPIEALFNPLPRLIRDLSQELGKNIELTLQGGDTELDRQLLEAIRDPLGHMIRNAADHGIEMPEDRRRLGKPEAGTIRLAAHQSGSQIVIELSDDGRGIDADQLRAKAVAMQIMPHAEAASLSESAALSLIFQPGLSTASSVTAISGRGVGMDVVRNNIERIGGTIEITSRPGTGTRFIIRMPLTLSIVPAMIFGVGGRPYAVAQSAVREVVRLTAANPLIVVGGRKMIELRDTFIPVMSLGEVFGDAPVQDNEGWGVIVEVGGVGRFAVLVDSLHDQEEIVIKPVSPMLGASGAYAGTTVLGSGDATLVLDLATLAGIAGIKEGAVQPEAREVETVQDIGESWMLFEAAGTTSKALPLSIIARIEVFDPADASLAGGVCVMKHDGRLLPLVSFGPRIEDFGALSGLVMILDDGRRRAALLIDRVSDIVADMMAIEQTAEVEGIAGLAIVQERSVEVVDLGWVMRHASVSEEKHAGSVLIIGNQQFAAAVLKPLLESAGHRTETVSGQAEASALLEGGAKFDLVLTESDAAAPQGVGSAVLRFAGKDSGEGVDPYDRDHFLEAINASLAQAGSAGR